MQVALCPFDLLLRCSYAIIISASLADCRETLVAMDAVDAEVALLLRPIKQVIMFELKRRLLCMSV